MKRGKATTLAQGLGVWKEKHLVQLWHHRRIPGQRVVTQNGDELRIVCPGWRNSDEGPDFQGAVLATAEGTLLKGDVEFHLRALDWYAHGHHRNRLYSGVVLHLVLWDQGEREALLCGGGTAPVASLAARLEGLDPEGIPEEEPISTESYLGKLPLSAEETLTALDKAGEARFLAKGIRFQRDLGLHPPQNVLYRGLMGSLGYARNEEPFVELAGRLPWETLVSAIRNKPSGAAVAWLQALLFGMAGLLPSQRRRRLHLLSEDLTTALELEDIWSSLCLGEAMKEEQWRMFRVRPGNHPARRLAGMSYLVERNRGDELMERLLLALHASGGSSPRWKLEEALIVEDNGYWMRHWDFGRGMRPGALIGWDRAREMVINVVLPFFWAWGRVTEELSAAESVMGLYHRYPAPEPNRITREMHRHLFPGEGHPPITTACQQQGLIHLYKTRGEWLPIAD